MTVTDKQEINSPDMEAYEAMKLLESGDSPAAIKKCMEAIDKFGDNRNCYLVKARAHIEAEEYDFAEEALKHVLRLDPEHPAAWAMMGEVYYRLGNEARVEYCRARLESIFPAITESFFQEEESTEIVETVEEDISETKSDDASKYSIVPLENVDNDSVEPDSLVDSAVKPEQVLPQAEIKKQEDEEDKTGGLKSELFETATFADICISQGKYEKAFNIYNKLLQNDPGNEKFIEKINLIKQKWDDNESQQID